ncbi:MAG TPA: Flp family type IVb pilin [Caulobacter sp.]|nr:Flp family type IVb pilin [Caulobacter sp.]
MGEARQTRGLSDAARGRTAGRLAARPALNRFWRDEGGATAVELGLLVALISLVLVGVLTGLGDNIKAALLKTATAVDLGS